MIRRLLIALLEAYRSANAALVRARFPLVAWSGCRQWPSCSEYAVNVIRERGAITGAALALRRTLHCSPLLRTH